MSIQVLIAGAPDCIGTPLARSLEKEGHRLRVYRYGEASSPHEQHAHETLGGDFTRLEDNEQALHGVEVAYYFSHHVGIAPTHTAPPTWAASQFTEAARRCGVRQIIYLSALGPQYDQLPPHQRAQQLTGQILRSSGVPVTELRAGPILGTSTYAYRLLSTLAERLPLFVSFKWAKTRIQPLALNDLLQYLTQALMIPGTIGHTLEVGGEILSYEEMIRCYAKLQRWTRFMVPVPVQGTGLSARLIARLTHLPYSTARCFLDELCTDAVVQNTLSRKLFSFTPMGCEEALQQALRTNSL